MNSTCPAVLLATLLLAAAAARANPFNWNADALSLRLEEVRQLPPPPAGVEELKFTEIYKLPVGPRGLELTDRVRSLAGKRVRILGFMVRQTRSAPGLAMLAPYALRTNETEFDFADDLPPTVIFVQVPKYEDVAVPFTPGPLLLTGTLEIGARQESDGRVSEIRLLLGDDAHPSTAPAAAASPFPPASGGQVQPSSSNS